MSNALSHFAQRFKQAPKPIRYGTYAVSAYAVYAVTLGLITPAVLKAKAPEIITQQTGRSVVLQQVSINPFLLRARIDGFAIQEADEQSAFTQFDRLELEFSFWKSLFTFTPTVDHVTLTGPKIALQRLSAGEHARFNFSDILDTVEANAAQNPPKDEADTHDAGIPAFRIGSIEIAQGQFHFKDDVTGAALNYDGLNLNLSQFDSQAYSLALPQNAQDKNLQLASAANHYNFMIRGVDNSQFTLKGQFQLAPLKVEGDVALQGLTLPPFWPFTADQMQASVTDGMIGFAAHYQLDRETDALRYQVSNGQFNLDHLTISDGQTPKVKLPSLAVHGIGVSSETQTVDIADVQINGLWVDAAMDRQGLDLQTLFQPKQAASTKTPDAAAQPKSDTEITARTDDSANGTANGTDDNANSTDDTAPSWLVRLNQFAMTDTDINVKESVQSSGVFWRVFPLSIKTGPVVSDLNTPIDYDVSLALSSSTRAQPETPRGEIKTSGSLDAKALSAQGQLAITDLDLTQLQPYLKPYVNLTLAKGKFSTQGKYAGDANGQASYQGAAAINTLLIRDTVQNQPLVKWQAMNIDALNFDAKKNTLKINTITFNAPYAKVMIAKDKRTNIGNLVVENKAPAAKSAPQAKSVAVKTKTSPANQKPLAIDIAAVKLVNGSAFFADNSLTPNFASGIESLQGSVRHLSSTPGTKAQVDIKGKIDKYAPVTLKGEINPLIEKPYLDLDLVFKSVELTSVNPYSGTYAGYYIDKGQLSLALNYKLDNNQLEGNNHLVIDQLKLGKPSESDLATSLPLTLAIAILQDKDGVIDLGVQVSGDVEDPSFSFGSVILKALSNIIVKAVTAPFSLLANLVGSDEELNHIAFAFGDNELSKEEQERLLKLAQALDSRPQLKLSIAASVSANDDSTALAEKQVQQAMLEESGLEAIPDNFSASRIADSEPLADAVETLAKKQLDLSIRQERNKVEQQLIERAEGKEVTDEQIQTTLLLGLYNQLVNATTITPEQLGNLAEARAKAVKTYLVDEAHIAPERVFLLDSKTQLKTESSGVDLTVDAQ
ncbi:DUF748 domain-containing protein [Vibrio furnissii]|uniref:DUF748 domain-containing protein n=1 Tax=Vibrio furnissii TaxID=29494 RepID=UPI0012AD72A2|nr:DUF748 domain-containing protein [Vibrio furnissii]